jgi:hypothetical protein
VSDTRPPFYKPGMKVPERQPRAGTKVWAILGANQLFVCELHDKGLLGVEVQLFRDGELLFLQRWSSGDLALRHAEDIKAQYLRAGGELQS